MTPDDLDPATLLCYCTGATYDDVRLMAGAGSWQRDAEQLQMTGFECRGCTGDFFYCVRRWRAA